MQAQHEPALQHTPGRSVARLDGARNMRHRVTPRRVATPRRGSRATPRCGGSPRKLFSLPTPPGRRCEAQDRSVGFENPDTIHGESFEEEVTLWLEVVSGSERGDVSFAEWLRDGHVLCAVADEICPGICGGWRDYNSDKIAAFVSACRMLGIPKRSLIQARDLHDGGDVHRLQLCIFALAGAARRAAPCFHGPYLEPTIQPRDSVEECWVVVCDHVVNVHASNSEDSWVLITYKQGKRLHGCLIDENWLELADGGGFVRIRCDGEEMLRQHAMVTVTLGKRYGMSPGIKWVTSPIGMQILSVDDGLVDVSNMSNPDRRIDVGDFIVSVNGVNGKDAIRNQWATRHVFAVQVLKPSASLRN